MPVCPECLGAIAPTQGPTCQVCGERLLAGALAGAPAAASEASSLLCGMCRRVTPPFERALAFGAYEAELRDLLHLFKYARVHPAAAVLGRMLAQVMDGLNVAGAVVVPVPLHAGKARQRGFNQAEQVARAALRLVARPERFRFEPGVLVRQRDTQSQTGLTRRQRRENVRGAFRVQRPEKILGRTVLLVDDVYTTGTTASECARVLRRAGAEKVFVATVARVLKSGAVSAESGTEAKTHSAYA